MAPRAAAGERPAGKKAPAARRPARVAQALELDFPARLVEKPVLYELVRRYDLVPNLRRANVTRDFGYMQLELVGRPRDLEAGLAWLRKAGVRVAPIVKDVLES